MMGVIDQLQRCRDERNEAVLDNKRLRDEIERLRAVLTNTLVDAEVLRRFASLPRVCATCKNWGDDHVCKRQAFPYDGDMIPNHWFGKRMAPLAEVGKKLCWEGMDIDMGVHP